MKIMTKLEIQEQFELMTTEAKKLIKKREDAPSFWLGIADWAAVVGDRQVEHADYCVAEAKRRIEELIKYASEID